jgi:hypothetical protein
MTPEELLIVTSEVFNVARSAIVGDSRIARTAQARHAFAWGLRKQGWSLDEIGNYLGRDHTTIIYGLARIEKNRPPQLGELERRMSMDRPTIVCLCGSTRFSEAFQQANLRETLDGKIVLSIGCDMRSDTDIFGHLPEAELDTIKARLDELHLRKIELADEVMVLNVGGYVGQSTARELAHARSLGKKVRFLEEMNDAA